MGPTWGHLLDSSCESAGCWVDSSAGRCGWGGGVGSTHHGRLPPNSKHDSVVVSAMARCYRTTSHLCRLHPMEGTVYLLLLLVVVAMARCYRTTSHSDLEKVPKLPSLSECTVLTGTVLSECRYVRSTHPPKSRGTETGSALQWAMSSFASGHPAGHPGSFASGPGCWVTVYPWSGPAGPATLHPGAQWRTSGIPAANALDSQRHGPYCRHPP